MTCIKCGATMQRAKEEKVGNITWVTYKCSCGQLTLVPVWREKYD